MRNKKVMLYLEESEYRRLKELAAREGKSMSSFVAGLIWSYDAPARKVAECMEYRCDRCAKTVWTDAWSAVPPEKCPYCNGRLVSNGRWGTVVLGPVR
ncbi:hypothetical protein SAMN02745218_01161 [Desulfofundulus australicus DSM 11792]|uniref:Ribbon-helix-helix protein, copG family n=1 Tax=Desulfofundulus australicus DSM 11792 TaxID=1121425 RepID=A0A1M4XT82_9FIRM|nr:hypothetical protein [Desulfofundulus australicus]SHE96648.1 hypothetical protein SAMN02745218_01161 [Desulfofundulus australicus DSM 11792]